MRHEVYAVTHDGGMCRRCGERGTTTALLSSGCPGVPDSTPTEREAGAAALAEAVTQQLGLYVLPANYAAPYSMFNEERAHWDVARNCGPLIADALAPLIAEREAKAWDDGYGCGDDDAQAEHRGYEPTGHTNPYRERAEDCGHEWVTMPRRISEQTPRALCTKCGETQQGA